VRGPLQSLCSASLTSRVFSVVYIFDALRQRNVIQLCLHLFFNLCILLYSILQIFQTKNAFETTPQDKCGSYPVSLLFLVVSARREQVEDEADGSDVSDRTRCTTRCGGCTSSRRSWWACVPSPLPL